MTAPHEDTQESHFMGFFRWRGSLNWKDITERAVAGFVAGTSAGVAFWLMERMLG